jgi:hypothetical protein
MTSYEPQCRACDHGQLRCTRGFSASVPTSWQALVNHTINEKGRSIFDLRSVIAPIGMACIDSNQCDWKKSCANGRDIHVPFCGACIEGYR